MGALPQPAGQTTARSGGPAPPADNARKQAGWTVVGFTCMAALCFWIWRQAVPPPAPVVPVVHKTARVQRANLEVRLRVTGQTTARNYRNVVAPRLRGPEGERPLVLLTLVRGGAMVRKNDIVATIDPKALMDHLDDTRADYRDRVNDVEKKKVQHELSMLALWRSAQEAKARLEKARLDLQTAEVRSAIRTQQMRLAEEEAAAVYAEKQEQLRLRAESQQADMRITDINRIRQLQHVERHEDDLKQFEVRAPMDGMVVLLAQNRPGGEQHTWAEGDTIRPGTVFMRILDTRNLQLEGTVNQADSGSFKPGQEARVHIDAYPAAGYRGRVKTVGALATGGFRQTYLRRIPVLVAIEDPDTHVIPDLTASASILIERQEDVLVAPASAVINDNGHTYVQVKTAAGFERREVILGANGGTEVSILNGVEEGEELLIN